MAQWVGSIAPLILQNIANFNRFLVRNLKKVYICMVKNLKKV